MKIASRTESQNRRYFLAAFILLKFLLQYLLVHPEYELHRDEYLHLDQASHLAWGYHSVPPATSWISWIIQSLGNSEFWVRFFPALFGALTILVVWRIIEELDGTLFALVLGAVCVLFSALLRINILYQPNSLDVLSWVTVYYLLLKYLNSENPKWLYIGAAALAVGFLNKYNIVFLILGLVPAILVTGRRRIFLCKHVYLAGLLALVLVSPNLWWQYQNDFPVIHHLNELSEKQLVNVRRLDFIKGQLVFFLGAIFVIITGMTALLVYRPFKKYQLFFWSFVFTISLFIYLKAKDYYAIGLYPLYIAFGAVAVSEFTKAGRKRILRPVVLAFPILFFALMFRVIFPNKSPEYILAHQDKYKRLGLLRWEDGRDHHLPQDFADMLGWKELAQKVDSMYRIVPDKKHTLVFCDNYGQAGAINYYTREGVRAVSFNADYIDWIELDRPYKHLIRVINRGDIAKELAEIGPFFEAVSVDSVSHPHARESGTGIAAFMGAKVNLNDYIAEEIVLLRNRRGGK